MVRIRPVNKLGRVLLHPPAEARGAAMVAGYRCSVLGIAAVDAAVRASAGLAAAPFTGAFGQQNFIDRDHASPDISISMENDNARERCGKVAGMRVFGKIGPPMRLRRLPAVPIHRSAPENPIGRSVSTRPKNPRQMHFVGRSPKIRLQPQLAGSANGRHGPSPLRLSLATPLRTPEPGSAACTKWVAVAAGARSVVVRLLRPAPPEKNARTLAPLRAEPPVAPLAQDRSAPYE